MAQAPLDPLLQRIRRNQRRSLRRAAQILFDKIKENASLTDHTLKDLEKLGHPYAVRAPQEIHTPNTLVHTQSGNLVDAIYMSTENRRIVVGVDEEIAPYVKFVIEGTAFMIPRDFVRQSLEDIRSEMTQATFDILSERIRS